MGMILDVASLSIYATIRDVYRSIDFVMAAMTAGIRRMNRDIVQVSKPFILPI